MAKRVGLRQDGGQNVGVKSFKQPAGGFGPYDPQAPRVKPNTGTPAHKAAVVIEDAIRGDALETGVFIAAEGTELLRRTGLPDQVTFTVLELSTKAGTTFTHNHPGNSSFSLDDYDNAHMAGVAELRAVTPQFRHILVMDAKMPSVAELARKRRALRLALSRRMDDMVKHDELRPALIGVELNHRLWTELAKHYGFSYTREPS